MLPSTTAGRERSQKGSLESYRPFSHLRALNSPTANANSPNPRLSLAPILHPAASPIRRRPRRVIGGDPSEHHLAADLVALDLPAVVALKCALGRDAIHGEVKLAPRNF